MPEQNRIVPTPAPADLPSFTLLANGAVIASAYGVVSVQVTCEVNRICEAEIIILDGDVATETFAASDSDDFIPGTVIEVKAGYHGNEATIFKGVIVKQAIRMLQADASVMVLTVKHAAYQLALVRKARVFADATDSDAIEAILDEYGVDKDVATTTVKHEHLVQYNATDWDFIVMRAEVNGLLVACTPDGIAVQPPDVGGRAALQLFYGASLLEFEAEMDGRNSYRTVKAIGWDAPSAELQEEEGTSDFGEEGNLSVANLNAALSVPELTLSAAPLSSGELEKWASGTATRTRLSKIKGRAKCIGFADIKPAGILEVNGVGARFNGKVFVSGVSQTLGAGKWETDLQFGMDFSPHAERFSNINGVAAGGLLPAVNGLQIGVVVKLEDPLGEGRVLVQLPAIGAGETVWARVSSLDAGKDRGSFFRPEVGDEVVLGFLDGDPRAAILLGGLNSSHLPAPVTATDSNHIKGFYSREQLKLVFDDEKKIVSIETPAGNKLVISDDDKGIALTDENGNSITLNADGIKLESSKDLILTASGDVKLEGLNIDLKASANFKAEGSAGASLKSSAVTEVKGSLVNVN